MNEQQPGLVISPTDWILFFAVIGGCFGSSIGSTVLILSDPSAFGAFGAFNTFSMLSLVGFEITTALLAIVAIVSAGWTQSDLPFRIDVSGTLTAFALAAIVIAVSALHVLVDAPNNAAPAPSAELSLAAVVLVSIVNPLFEEFFVLGFVVRFFERRGGLHWQTAAVATSVVIRTAYHVYQGLDALPFHAIVGLLFALTFLLRRNLWPMVFTHAVFLNFIPLFASTR